jgi:hypothetical protein
MDIINPLSICFVPYEPCLFLTIVPIKLYKHLKKSAEIKRRSINSEIVVCIERALRSRRISPNEILSRARYLRAKTAGHPVAESEIVRAKAEGRP